MNNEEPNIHPYNKSFLLFWHIILGLGLTAFTLAPIAEYKNHALMAFIVSFTILLLYFLILKKSATVFNQGRAGFAYFLTIVGFIILVFTQFMNCANSIVIH